MTEQGFTNPYTTYRRSDTALIFEDGRELFSVHACEYFDDWRDTRIGPVNLGTVRALPTEEWCRDPNGSLRPTTFIAEAMRSVGDPR